MASESKGSVPFENELKEQIERLAQDDGWKEAFTDPPPSIRFRTCWHGEIRTPLTEMPNRCRFGGTEVPC